jgi:hypothetical protein
MLTSLTVLVKFPCVTAGFSRAKLPTFVTTGSDSMTPLPVSIDVFLRNLRLIAVALALLALLACGEAADQIPDGDADGEPALPDSCESPTGLFDAFELLADQAHPCYPWLDRVIGRVIVQSNASAAIWTTRTPNGAALVATAMHTLGAGWFGDVDEDLPERTYDPLDTIGTPRLFLVDADGAFVHGLDQSSAIWPIYHPEIPAAENSAGLFDILPRHDLVLGLVDDQLLDVSLLGQMPDKIRAAAPDLYDPLGDAQREPAWGEPQPGDLLLTVGKPAQSQTLQAVVGRVLSDAEAEDAVFWLADEGDEEGDIAYDAQAEMLLDSLAYPGMSGSGVFDAEGRLCGILVRGSEISEPRQIVRAVRLSYVVMRLRAYLTAQTEKDRELIEAWLPEGMGAPGR